MKPLIALLFAVLILAACDTNTTALTEEMELGALAINLDPGDGTIVTEASTDWLTTGTTLGAVAFTGSFSAPTNLGTGALSLTTDADNAARAQISKAVDIALADVGSLSYYTLRDATATQPIHAAVAVKLSVRVDGEWTMLVYEPYWNGVVDQTGAWQFWGAIDEGLWWSSRSAGNLVGAAGGPPAYTLADVVGMHGTSVVEGITLGIGSYNPGWSVAVDGFTFGGTLFNFEPPLATKDVCKDGGWQAYEFKNQGQCIAYFQANENSAH